MEVKLSPGISVNSVRGRGAQGRVCWCQDHLAMVLSWEQGSVLDLFGFPSCLLVINPAFSVRGASFN